MEQKTITATEAIKAVVAGFEPKKQTEAAKRGYWLLKHGNTEELKANNAKLKQKNAELEARVFGTKELEAAKKQLEAAQQAVRNAKDAAVENAKTEDVKTLRLNKAITQLTNVNIQRKACGLAEQIKTIKIAVSLLDLPKQ